MKVTAIDCSYSVWSDLAELDDEEWVDPSAKQSEPAPPPFRPLIANAKSPSSYKEPDARGGAPCAPPAERGRGRARGLPAADEHRTRA